MALEHVILKQYQYFKILDNIVKSFVIKKHPEPKPKHLGNKLY